MASKINFNVLGIKAAGLALGTMAAGFIKGLVSKTNAAGEPMMNDIMQAGVLIGAGAFAPDFIGKKNPMLGSAGDAIMVKGVDTLLRKFFPNAVKGLDDSIAGEGDYEVGDAGESIHEMVGDADIVSGPDDESVSGGGNTI